MTEAEDDRPRAVGGRAPDVFRRGGWVPMRSHPDTEEVDFAIVGTGAGGATLACRLAEAGFSVVAFDAGAWWRPLEDFASDERSQHKLYWNDDRIVDGDDPLTLGSNNSGRAVGGSTVHYQMVSLRFRPDWFKARSLLGYGHDWPVTWEEMEPYYEEVEEALKIAGPVSYPWGPPRGPYPYRAHEVNAAGLKLAQACDALGVAWSPTPLATLSAPRGLAHPCVYRGFCKYGCSTNAKQGALTVWIPRALKAGAEIRDRAMVARVEMDGRGRASGLVYRRDGAWRMQKARNVVVAGYSVETPRLLLNSATAQFPDGLANSSGMVGKSLMVHSNHASWARFPEEIRWYKGPPSMATCEHWNYNDTGKDFPGHYAFMSQGPMPVEWAHEVANTGLWGMPLRQKMADYNHFAGFRIVGETMPQDRNQVRLSDQVDEYGLPVARVTFGYHDDDKKLFKHAMAFMEKALDAIDGQDIFSTSSTAHLMGGCRIGDDPRTSVVNPDGRTWDVPNLWVCDGSLFPTAGGVNPSLTIQAMACRIADRIKVLAGRGELAA